MSKRKPPIKSARTVMASRKEKSSSRDDFFTPPWATRALMRHVLPRLAVYGRLGRVWEPACGEGHMAAVLAEYEGTKGVIASDVHDYGYGEVRDFLTGPGWPSDWIITNPPFTGTRKRGEPKQDRALEFTLRALKLARIGVAMFLPLRYLECIERYERLYRDQPPTLIAPFVERVPICKGRWDPDGGTATAYCWLVWIHGRDPMPPFWIPPGRKKALTKPDDRERFAAWSMAQKEAAE